MKKTTSKNLSKRLANYGALSAAIAGLSGINAQEQIDYTDINPDYSGIPDPYYIIDFDGDTANDFVVYQTVNGLYGYVYGSNKLLGSVFAFTSSTYSSYIGLIYPFALNDGAIISGGQNSWLNQYYGFDSGFNILNVLSGAYGNWYDVSDKFLGVQFKIGANTHYGWVRLSVGTSGSSWTIKDYAYNITPNAPILAGQTTSLGIGDDNISKVKIVALNKSIGLYNLQNKTNFRLLNMTGQEILKGTTENKDYVIEASTLASGVYIVELGDIDTNTFFRKKIVLQ